MTISVGHAVPAAGRLANPVVWGAAGRLAWLVEGLARPTSTRGRPRQPAGDYAAALARRLAQTAYHDDLSLQALTRRAIHDTPRFTADPDDPGPAAALALARTGGEMTEWLVLGPTTVLLPPPAAGQEAIAKTDDRLEDTHTRLRARFRRARARAGGRAQTRSPRGPNRAERLAARLEAAEAANRNVHGGHWLAAGVADAGLEALKGRYQTRGPVCLASSGAMATADDWFSWSAVGADLDAAAAPLARASGDEAAIVVLT